MKKEEIKKIINFVLNNKTNNKEYSTEIKKFYNFIISFCNKKSKNNAVESNIGRILEIESTQYGYFKTISTDKRKENCAARKFLLEVNDNRFLSLINDYESRLKKQIQKVVEIKKKYYECIYTDLINKVNEKMTDMEIKNLYNYVQKYGCEGHSVLETNKNMNNNFSGITADDTVLGDISKFLMPILSSSINNEKHINVFSKSKNTLGIISPGTTTKTLKLLNSKNFSSIENNISSFINIPSILNNMAMSEKQTNSSIHNKYPNIFLNSVNNFTEGYPTNIKSILLENNEKINNRILYENNDSLSKYLYNQQFNSFYNPMISIDNEKSVNHNKSQVSISKNSDNNNLSDKINITIKEEKVNEENIEYKEKNVLNRNPIDIKNNFNSTSVIGKIKVYEEDILQNNVGDNLYPLINEKRKNSEPFGIETLIDNFPHVEYDSSTKNKYNPYILKFKDFKSKNIIEVPPQNLNIEIKNKFDQNQISVLSFSPDKLDCKTQFTEDLIEKNNIINFTKKGESAKILDKDYIKINENVTINNPHSNLTSTSLSKIEIIKKDRIRNRLTVSFPKSKYKENKVDLKKK